MVMMDITITARMAMAMTPASTTATVMTMVMAMVVAMRATEMSVVRMLRTVVTTMTALE